MGQAARPTVLIVDDNPDELRPLENDLRRQVNVETVDPAEVTQQKLSAADLVLVDLILEDWIARGTPGPLANRPRDGLAVTIVLRSHATARKNPPVKAFAILSGRLDEVSPALPRELREHALARLNNLEWVFEKADAGDLPDRIRSLAHAVQELPKTWPLKKAGTLKKVIGMNPDVPWAQRAWQDVEECHPPVHELAEESHGLAVLRWLLHRILPYPCFLWDMYALAARLRVSRKSLNDELGRNKSLRRLLSQFQFKGILSDFLGPRWWRSGVENFVWEITDGAPSDSESIQKYLFRRTRARLQPANDPHPVVCLDDRLRPMETFYGPEQAVRIQPDDWPPFADQAWTTIELASQAPSLRMLVIQQDRERLQDAG
jgi:CheY-like chemotaxis protein